VVRQRLKIRFNQIVCVYFAKLRLQEYDVTGDAFACGLFSSRFAEGSHFLEKRELPCFLRRDCKTKYLHFSLPDNKMKLKRATMCFKTAPVNL
jgi:hypothetical protein